MNYNKVLASLYFQLAYADGSVNDKETATAKEMISAEGIQDLEFSTEILGLKSKDKSTLFDDAMLEMKQLDRTQQIRIIAWLCVVANADGFMDRTEWQLIYRIYHKELGLPLSEIFTVQKELNRMVWGKSTLTIL